MRNFVWGSCVAALVSGCGAPDPGPSPSAASDPESAELVGTSEAELSFHEQCDTETADDYIVGNGLVTSGRNYNHAGCAKAYLVNLIAYTPIATQPNELANFYWADTPPDNQVDCERASLLIYAWDTTVQEWAPATEIGSKGVTGVWALWNGTYKCLGLGWFFGVPPAGPQLNHWYRYAVSARQGLANGSYATRKVAVDVR